MQTASRKKEGSRRKKILVGAAVAAGVTGGAYLGRNQIGKAYTRVKREATKKRYNYGSRSAFVNSRTGERTSVRINNESRQKAFEHLSSRGYTPSNKDINSYLTKQRQSVIGGVGTKGRNAAEKSMMRQMQKNRSAQVGRKVARLKKQGNYFKNRLNTLSLFALGR
jgi:hypothetical protein